MFTRGWKLVSAEIFQIRHRTSTWVLIGTWATLALFFGYILPYLIDDDGAATRARPGEFAQPSLLPDQFVSTVIGGFPFYGGAIALMMGVLTVGSEFGWGTFKTLFTQRAGRVQVVAAKLAALGIMLFPFVLLSFGVGAAASAVIAMLEGATLAWPSFQQVIEAMLAGWLIMAAWAAVGVALAVVTRGTSLAIGIGILYALVIEGLVSNFANQISWLEPAIRLFLRANAYSLVQPFGAAPEAEGPGRFTGPFVGTEQALLVLLGYIVITCGLAAVLLRRRDIA